MSKNWRGRLPADAGERHGAPSSQSERVGVICWYCEKWEEVSPETFARRVAVSLGSGNSLDAGLLRAARKLGTQIVLTTPAKTLKKMAKNMATHGTVVVAEGLQASDGSHITKEDYVLFNWAAGHVIAEWGDHSTQAERIH